MKQIPVILIDDVPETAQAQDKTKPNPSLNLVSHGLHRQLRKSTYSTIDSKYSELCQRTEKQKCINNSNRRC